VDELRSLEAGPSFTEQAYRAVRRQVLSGSYGPGDRLKEAALAERLGISRGPVREAVEKLVQEGLVVRVPRRGVFVRRYTLDDVRALMELRSALELEAVRLGTERATEADLAGLQRALAEADLAIDRDGGYPTDADFHGAIVRLSKNPYLERAAGLVYDQLRLARSLAGRRSVRAREAWGEHAAVLRALIERDAGAARLAVRRHLAAAEATMLGLLTAAGPEPREARRVETRAPSSRREA